MKFIVAIILTALVSYTAYLYSTVLPWYAFAFGALVVGLVIPQQAWKAWLSGFTGLIICWVLLIRNMDKLNDSLLSARMATVLPFDGSTGYLIMATAFIGGLVSGFAALSGSFLRFK